MFTNQVTESKVLDAIKGAVIKGPMTAQQRREQTISFVYGTLSSKSTLTREQVADMVNKQYGS